MLKATRETLLQRKGSRSDLPHSARKITGDGSQAHSTMRTTGKKQAIRNALFRFGLHATPKGIIDALAQQGVQVNEQVVRAVLIEMLKETTGTRVARGSRPVPSPAVRRVPKGFPQ